MGVVKTTYVAARGPVGTWAFRRLAASLATPRSLLAAIVSGTLSRGSGDIDDEVFDRVARAIDQPRLVLPPFAVLGGPGASRCAAWRVRDGIPETDAPVRLLYAGAVATELAPAVRAALSLGNEVCVWYASLPFGRGQVLDHDPHGECRVTLRRSPEPVELAVGSAYDDDPASVERGPTTTTWLEITGKSAPDADEIASTPVGAHLRSSFGKVWIATDYA